MSVTDKIRAIDIRIATLTSRGAGVNTSIVNKLWRKRRALEAKL